MTISYAQHREDIILHRALRHVELGFYIDVGAYLPMEYSATKMFYDRGWSGINLEPCTAWLDALNAARPRDINLGIAASDTNGTIEFHQITDPGNGPLSTVVESVFQKLQKDGLKTVSYRVPTQRLDALCEQYSVGDIHFLKIDVEGAERQVLMGADFKKYRPWIVVIEAFDLENRLVVDAWESILLEANYAPGLTHSKNRFYWAKERPELEAPLSVLFDEYETREAVGERAAAEERYGRLEKLYLDARATVANLKDAGVQAAATITSFEAEIAALEGHIGRLESDIMVLKAEVQAMVDSTSWKLTAPLRSLGAFGLQLSKRLRSFA